LIVLLLPPYNSAIKCLVNIFFIVILGNKKEAEASLVGDKLQKERRTCIK